MGFQRPQAFGWLQGTALQVREGQRPSQEACGRRDSNPHSPRGTRFSYHFGFRRRGLMAGVRGLDCPFTMAMPPKVPPVQSLHLPQRVGLGSGLA